MTSLALCRASSKMSIMPSVATRRSDTKVLLNLKRNTSGRSPFERLKPVHPKGCTSDIVLSFRRPLGVGSETEGILKLMFIVHDTANQANRSREQAESIGLRSVALRILL